MEALTAASVAALTVYDMVKGIERGAEIASVALLRSPAAARASGAARAGLIERWRSQAAAAGDVSCRRMRLGR